MRKKFYSISFFLLFFLFSFLGKSATYYSRINGNWNTASTWSLVSCSGIASASIPTAADNVIICTGRTVTMNGSPANCLSLTISGTANWTSSVTTIVGAGGLILNNGSVLSGSPAGTLVVLGPMTVSAGATATIGNVILSVSGLTSINGVFSDNSMGGSNTFANVNLNLGGSFFNTASETYTITGNLNTYGGDFLASGATPRFNIAGDFNVVSSICDISRIRLTVSGTTTVSGTLAINTTRGTKTFNNFIITPTGVFNSAAAEDYRINGNIQADGAFNGNLGIYTLAGVGKTISGSSSIIFDDVTCTGFYTNNALVRIMTSFRGTGTWNQGALGSVTIETTNVNFSVNTFNASTVGNIVIYNRNGAQNIRIPTDGSYSNLTISGGNIKSLVNATTLKTSLLISATTTLATSNNNLVIGGNFTNNGTFTAGVATVTLNGTVAQTIDGTSSSVFSNLTISNASAIVTGATNFSVSNTLNIGAGAVLSPNAAIIVSGAGTLTGNGTARVTRIAVTPDFISQYTITGKTLSGLNIDYIGAGNQVVNILNYGSLTISTNGVRTVTFPAAVVGVSNVFSPTSVTTVYVINGNTINFNGTVAQTIPAFNYHHLTSSSTGTRTLAPSGTIGVAGIFTPSVNVYTITGSTINFNGTIAQGIPAFNYYNLSSSSTGSRTLAAAGIIGIAAAFVPGTNSYTVTNSTINMNGTIAQSIPAFTYHNLISAGSAAKSLSGNIVVNNDLTITSNLDVTASNYSISVKRNWINNGTFNAQNGAVIFNGSVPQTLSGTGTTTFNQLDMNNTAGGVSLASGTYILNSVINPLNGNFNTNSQSFTMVSDASRTARIGQVAATASLSGNFIVQRYITARDTSFADLCSPVQSSTFTDWDNELPALSYTHTPPSALASAFTYDETADVYVPITSASAPLTEGQGFEVFLAGDYTYASLPNSTMDVIGVPNQGDKNLSSLISNNVQGWNLVGNPFASNISWASIYIASGGAASGLYDFIEMYDYTIGDWNGYTSADGIEIGSAQGFWVYGLPLASPLTLIIPESSKTTTSNSTIKAPTKTQPYFTLKIGSNANNFSHTFKVDAKAGASDNIDAKDLPYRPSPNKATPALYSSIDGTNVNLNTFNSENGIYSMPLVVKVNVSGNYKIEAAGFEFMKEYKCIQLEDRLKNIFINLTSQSTYEFEMFKLKDEKRFVLHFNKNADCKQSIASQDIAYFDNSVEVLPTQSGNVINFNYSEATQTAISVYNMLGQDVVEERNLSVSSQSEAIQLPADFVGIYFIKISSDKGTVVKKFFKK